jgi:cytoskeleton protein RodZ
MLLRTAREATGLHIAALAVAMKVPVKKLEALEADRLGELPDAVFVRALAASMCRALKVDPAPVLNRLPQTAAPKFDRDDRGINMPYSAPSFQYSHSLKSLLAKPAVLLVLALLVAALAVMWVPDTRSTARSGESAAVRGTTNLAGAATPADQASASAMATQSATPPQPAGSAAAVAPVAVAVAAVSAPATAPVQAVSAAVAPRPAATASDLVVFKAKATAWVRVTDAKGAVQFEKTLAAGETGMASGLLPLSVVVGNVGATEVAVRGQPFGLEAFVKDNVARFEVK